MQQKINKEKVLELFEDLKSMLTKEIKHMKKEDEVNLIYDWKYIFLSLYNVYPPTKRNLKDINYLVKIAKNELNGGRESYESQIIRDFLLEKYKSEDYIDIFDYFKTSDTWKELYSLLLKYYDGGKEWE